MDLSKASETWRRFANKLQACADRHFDAENYEASKAVEDVADMAHEIASELNDEYLLDQE